MPKLIIIRGPSGSGKSTVATELFQQVSEQTILIQQDHFRFILNPAGGGSEPNLSLIKKLIWHNTSLALESGYNVILEGNLIKEHFGLVLQTLATKHTPGVYAFYFDISLEETLLRHRTRDVSERFGTDEMTSWYNLSTPLGFDCENLIPQECSKGEAIALIKDVAGF
ncbi:AAA family ATPase [Photobacterium sp. OFAV2-7]|uniref:AAA family ATPase n=1 Tax=Photobacterium sp. OFAV2-7 TaxID=2917748 RepID=UPI001EF669D7|nr:AAA family ATPase [Photobacterium sp. OFAV2-7]MCG7585957.1 AAA family ATPase [Photobacterium sp. OFAV2-7]